MEQNKRLLNPKLDVVFQALFGEEGSEGITKSFFFKKKKTRRKKWHF